MLSGGPVPRCQGFQFHCPKQKGEVGSSVFGEEALGPCWQRDMGLDPGGWSGAAQAEMGAAGTPKEMGP